MRRPTKAAFCVVLAATLASLSALRAAAWGGEGHRIVARIAYARLRAPARARVDAILADESIESAAVWPDGRTKKAHPETAPWHYADIPLGGGPYAYAPGCGCVTARVASDVAVLADAAIPDAAKRDDLRFLVHFVGDLHQPLHSTTAQKLDPVTRQPVFRDGAIVYDRGGNDFLVTFFAETTIPLEDSHHRPLPMELHWVWDSSLIEHEIGNDDPSDAEIESYADALDAAITADAAESIRRGGVVDWINDSHAIGEANAYADEHGARLAFGTTLRGPYYERNIPVVDGQLGRAGVRLAWILNAIFDPQSQADRDLVAALEAAASGVETWPAHLERLGGSTHPRSGGATTTSVPSVYYNPHGSAYHVRSCDYVGPNSRRTTVRAAKRRRLTACHVCRPPE